MLSRQFLTDMCRLSTMAYRENSFISDLFDNLNGNRPHSNEFCVLEKCHTCPSLIQGDLSQETDIIQNDAQAYACRYDESLAIVFRGTESFRDVLTDLNMIRVRMDLPGHTGDTRPKVHWGFLRQFRTIEEQVREHIEFYIKDCDEFKSEDAEAEVEVNSDSEAGEEDPIVQQPENKVVETSVKDIKNINNGIPNGPPIKHVVFSGHSLGGALATLAAVQFAKQYPDITVTCVTFGSPRVGNGSFAEMFNKCCKGSYRFVNEDDPVPMGPTPLRFTHVKGGKWIDDDQLLLQKPWMRSLTFFKNLFLSFIGLTHNPVSDHGCLSYLTFISGMQE